MPANDLTPADLDALYLAIFEDDRRGAAVLEDLHARFGTPKVTTDGGIDAVLKTYTSTAKSTVVAYILNRIARAKGERTLGPADPDQEAPTA